MRFSLHQTFRSAKAFWRSVVILLLLLAPSNLRADIYEWEYINPADPSQGKQQSSTLVPDGAGVNLQPGADLRELNLTKAYLVGANLVCSDLYRAILTNSDLSYANFTDTSFLRATLTDVDLSHTTLKNANFELATLTNANFSGADMERASFKNATGFTATQLYSTANYQAGDLSGISLENSDLTSWNFAGQKLNNVRFGNAVLTDADFSGADIRGTYFLRTSPAGLTAAQLYSTESYQAHDLTGVRFGDAGGWNLAGQNLVNAAFGGLSNTDLSGADVRGASFESATNRGFVANQLYSTSSYQSGDLIGITLRSNDLTGWSFASQNLTDARLSSATLTNADFANANLTNADFFNTRLSNANLAGTEVRGANFSATINFSAAQLYSTASYQAGDLTGIDLGGINRTGWNFAGQNLTNAKFDYGKLADADLSQANVTNADFQGTSLTGVNFTGAVVRGANFTRATNLDFTAAQLYSTASYEQGDLSGIGLELNNLTGWNFASQNLTDADFETAVLTNANLTGAIIKGASFSSTTHRGFTSAQLYSTASYQAGDLTGINLFENNLTGWNFSGQMLADVMLNYATLSGANLTGTKIQGASLAGTTSRGFTAAQLYSTASYREKDLSEITLSQNDLTSWNFAGQRLTDAHFASSTLTDTDFSGADTRGATGLNPDVLINTNMIRPDGIIQGLDLTEGQSLVIRNYSGDPSSSIAPIPVHVNQSMTMDSTGRLRLVFDEDPWNSLISFELGIPIDLNGTLELTFAPEVDLATQSGRTIDLFDWTGVSPIGAFTVTSPYTWNLSNLYTTGEVILIAIPGLTGDYNLDGIVNAADYVMWRDTSGSPTGYGNWRSHFDFAASEGSGGSLNSAVPEPAAWQLALCILFAAAVYLRRSV